MYKKDQNQKIQLTVLEKELNYILILILQRKLCLFNSTTMQIMFALITHPNFYMHGLDNEFF